jgi:hypothetical protein
MTTTDDRPMYTCPSWCEGCQGSAMAGEHHDEQTYIPATGTGRPVEITVEQGAAFPVLAVGLNWSQADGWPTPAVVLWKTGTGKDEEVYLTPREARSLVTALQSRLEDLEVEGRG